jgi:hypothetical protein
VTTIEQIKQALDCEEPRYGGLASSLAGDPKEIFDYLAGLARGHDLLMASRAVHFASKIGDHRRLALLIEASRRAEPIIRVAVAGASRNLDRDDCAEVLLPLLGDPEVGVRKIALHSVPVIDNIDILTRVRRLFDDPNSHIRLLARKIVSERLHVTQTAARQATS